MHLAMRRIKAAWMVGSDVRGGKSSFVCVASRDQRCPPLLQDLAVGMVRVGAGRRHRAVLTETGYGGVGRKRGSMAVGWLGATCIIAVSL